MGAKSDLLDVAGLFFEGRFKAVVDSVHPLADARRSHEVLESGAPFGKVILRV